MRVSKRQILKLIYEQQVQDSKSPAEVEPEEDVWGTGEDLEHPIDHEKEAGLPSNVTEPEVMEIVEKVLHRRQLKRRLQKLVREQAAIAAEEEVVVDPALAAAEVEGEERASASQQSLRNWLKDTAASVAGLAIPDGQIPALIASMDDLILSAQSGKMSSREDKVRAHIDTE